MRSCTEVPRRRTCRAVLGPGTSSALCKLGNHLWRARMAATRLSRPQARGTPALSLGPRRRACLPRMRCVPGPRGLSARPRALGSQGCCRPTERRQSTPGLQARGLRSGCTVSPAAGSPVGGRPRGAPAQDVLWCPEAMEDSCLCATSSASASQSRCPARRRSEVCPSPRVPPDPRVPAAPLRSDTGAGAPTGTSTRGSCSAPSCRRLPGQRVGSRR